MARPQEKGFAAATAESTGMTKQAINRHIARANALGDDALTQVANTSLDSGVELDALAKLDAPECAQLIERAVAGEQVSARAQTWEALHPEEQGGKTVPTLGGNCRREDRPGGVVSLQPTLHKTGSVSPRTPPQVEIIFSGGGTAPKIAIALRCYDRLYPLACLNVTKKEGEGRHSAVIHTRMVTTGRGDLIATAYTPVNRTICFDQTLTHDSCRAREGVYASLNACDREFSEALSRTIFKLHLEFN